MACPELAAGQKNDLTERLECARITVKYTRSPEKAFFVYTHLDLRVFVLVERRLVSTNWHSCVQINSAH